MNRRLMILALSAITTLSCATSLRAVDPARSLIPPAPAASEDSLVESKRAVGVAGCSAASCHGGRSLVGGEASAWLARDVAHRQAYDVLWNETSQRIAQKLGLNAAHTEARCLACHSTEVGRTVTETGERFAVEYGVACESCHGAAAEWVSRHTQRSWRSMSSQERAALGFKDLHSLTERAETCIACHVGSPRATVDHDLIAAGHPRLAFEMSAYHALLPKHWDAAAEIRADRVREVRLWGIGQGLAAKAVADIAAARADAAIRAGHRDAVSDLAEFDCQACHHDLADESWRGRSALRDLGQPRWGSWNVNPASFLTRESIHAFGVDGSAAEASVSKLVTLMQRSRLAATPAEQLAGIARQSSMDLAAWSRSLDASSMDAAKLRQLLQRTLSSRGKPDSDWLPTWDGQTQRYLAVVAVRAALRDLNGPDVFGAESTSQLRSLQLQLRFPANYATPHAFEPKKVERLFDDLLQTMNRSAPVTN